MKILVIYVRQLECEPLRVTPVLVLQKKRELCEQLSFVYSDSYKTEAFFNTISAAFWSLSSSLNSSAGT